MKPCLFLILPPMCLPLLYPEVVWVLDSSPCRTYPPAPFHFLFVPAMKATEEVPKAAPAVPSSALWHGAVLPPCVSAASHCLLCCLLPHYLPQRFCYWIAEWPETCFSALRFPSLPALVQLFLQSKLHPLTIAVAQITFLSLRFPANPSLSDQGAVLLQTRRK